MALTSKQRRHLRAMCHHLSPVVIIGNAGLSGGVINEIDEALSHHELIKIKIAQGDRAVRKQIVEEIRDATKAESVQEIGHIVALYRPSDDPQIRLPKA